MKNDQFNLFFYEFTVPRWKNFNIQHQGVKIFLRNSFFLVDKKFCRVISPPAI